MILSQFIHYPVTCLLSYMYILMLYFHLFLVLPVDIFQEAFLATFCIHFLSTPSLLQAQES
jgi:hypothetical protein